jgi:flagellar motor protein MotB
MNRSTAAFALSFALLFGVAPLRADEAAPAAENKAAAPATEKPAAPAKKASAPAKKAAAPKAAQKAAPAAKPAAAAKSGAKPAADAKAPADAKAAPAADQPAAKDKDASAAKDAAPTKDENLDVTISADSKDEIPLTKDAPSTDISFEKVVSLSREGQTERVLTGPVEHMTGEDQMRLLQVDSRQAYLGLPARIPSAPFIRMEISPGLTSYLWELQILDQDDQAMKALEGTDLPKYLVEWDGFQNGAFKLRAGPAYTPVLVLTDDRKRSQRYFGEPVQFAALQYIQDGLLHIEFDNNRLFERGRAGFSQDMQPYLAAALNLLRQHEGKPIRVVIHAQPGGNLPTQKRLDNLKAYFVDGLALEPDMISFVVQPGKDRGDVTEIMAMN